MQLDDLKKSMSTLDQVLAKTNTDITINVSASETAKSKILKKFRQVFTSCLIIAFVFIAMALGNQYSLSFPNYLKIGMAVYLFVAAVWYIFLFRYLKNIDIATLPPAQLFSKTTTLKLMVISSEAFFGICLAVFFTLLFQTAWVNNPIGFWAMAVTITFAIIYGIVHLWPQYIKLFRDLNSIK